MKDKKRQKKDKKRQKKTKKKDKKKDKKETRKITVFESLFLWDILNQEIRYGLHFFTRRST